MDLWNNFYQLLFLQRNQLNVGWIATHMHFVHFMHTLDDVTHDLRTETNNNNFVPKITSYLKKFPRFSSWLHELVKDEQEKHKSFAYK